MSRPSLNFPLSDRAYLEPHLPKPTTTSPYPFTTVTFATSLDSALSLSPSIPTPLSGPETKSLTHYLRSRHDAILIGAGTAIADNPSLNCRLEGVGGYGGVGLDGQPRPVVVDPQLRWDFEKDGCKLLELVKEGRGKAPWIVTSLSSNDIPPEKRRCLESVGGSFLHFSPSVLTDGSSRIRWTDILRVLKSEGIESVMIEGGGSVINALLQQEYFEVIDSVIVTIAPVWLGQGGVVVSPVRSDAQKAALRLRDVQWKQFGQDVVMCGRVNDSKT